MESRELARLQTHYARMKDDELQMALYYGPDAYRSSEVWKIIVEEAGRRGLAVPTTLADIREHWVAEYEAELAKQQRPMPWGWRLYIWLTLVILLLIMLFDLLIHDFVGFGVVCVVAWLRHRHVVALRKRFRGVVVSNVNAADELPDAQDSERAEPSTGTL